MWALIYIKLIFPQVGYYDIDAQMYGTYETMEECFYWREALILDLGHISGYAPPNSQVVCVRTENEFDNFGN